MKHSAELWTRQLELTKDITNTFNALVKSGASYQSGYDKLPDSHEHDLTIIDWFNDYDGEFNTGWVLSIEGETIKVWSNLTQTVEEIGFHDVNYSEIDIIKLLEESI